MAGDWAEVALGDVITLQRGFDLPSPNRKPGTVPIVSSSGISDYHSEVGVKGPGVVTGRYGTIGQVFLIKEDYWPLNTTLWVKDFHGNDPHFASYLLRTVDFQSCSDKSSVPGVNRNDLHRIPVLLPPLAEQKAIAAVLGALDDKIELNSRMNATLEAMARALFQSWFVDFDPVRAKLDGRKPVGLDAATAALFPDSFQDTALGSIPQGWKVQTADEVSTVGIGKTPPRKEHQWFSENPADVPWMSIRDLGIAGVFISHTSEFLTSEAVEKFRVKRIPDNTVVLSFKLTMGRVAITDGEMLSNEAIAHFRLNPDTAFGPEYLYCYLKGFGYDQLGSTSSIATAINSDMVRGMRVLVPPKGVAEAFAQTVKPLFTQMKNIQKQSHTLATLRDTLLPKLLSGELKTTI
ncbi:restriction endonuclease [Betaproteobacteria bacterium UKL13-2]|jgi:type I restriction enzyme S subunit|nr:restriction endonuclease [Betaproteobacteria bacterium UKL13-2]HCG53568.1 restriction endonuclease subunit S [Betaproteobacteria bacterium]